MSIQGFYFFCYNKKAPCCKGKKSYVHIYIVSVSRVLSRAYDVKLLPRHLSFDLQLALKSLGERVSKGFFQRSLVAKLSYLGFYIFKNLCDVSAVKVFVNECVLTTKTHKSLYNFLAYDCVWELLIMKEEKQESFSFLNKLYCFCLTHLKLRLFIWKQKKNRIFASKLWIIFEFFFNSFVCGKISNNYLFYLSFVIHIFLKIDESNYKRTNVMTL